MVKNKKRSTVTKRTTTRRSSKKHPLHKRIFRHLTQRGFTKPKLIPLIVALSVAGIGVYFLVFTKAATPARPAYSYFGLQTGTGLHKTVNDSNWAFAAGNFDGDGKPDFYVIKKVGASSTEVHILGSASNYKTFILQTATPLHNTAGDNYWFDVYDYDGDKRDDLYLIKKNGQTTTEVHILSAKSNFQTWIAHSITSLHKTDADGNWRFKIGDFDADGRGDLYAIQTKGSNFKTDVHIMSAKDNFQKFALQSNSVLHDTAHDATNWDFDTGNFDGDNRADLFAIKKNGTSNTEIHVLTASSNFNGFGLQTGTGLHKTTADPNWNFTTGDYDKDGKADLFAIQKNGASNTEIHILASKYIAAVNDPAPTTAPTSGSSPAPTSGSSPAPTSGSSPAPTNNAPSPSPAPSTPAPAPVVGTDCSRTYLVQGSRGTCVSQAQRLLNAKGYNAGTADGIYGNNTAAAVARLKTLNVIVPCSAGSSINTQAWDVLYGRYIPINGATCASSATRSVAPAPAPSAPTSGSTNLPRPSVYHGDGSDSKIIGVVSEDFVATVPVKICVSISPKTTSAISISNVSINNETINLGPPTTINGIRAYVGCRDYLQSTTMSRTYSLSKPGYWVNVYEGK